MNGRTELASKGADCRDWNYSASRATPQPNPDTREVVNFGGNLRFTPGRYYLPRSEDEVLEILERHAREHIRVVGSRHAWSGGIVSSDVIIDTRHLNKVEISEPAPGETLATVGGGCQIKLVLQQLQARAGATLPAIGLITEQTIAGAIATATHGSGRHSLSHYMDEIRTAAYDPETGRARVYVWNSGDELRAARCSLGCLGVILSVRFRCIPQYLVADRLEQCTGIDQILAHEEAFPLQQFYLVPHLWAWFVHRRNTSHDLRRSWYAGLYRVYWFLGIDIWLHLIIKFMVSFARSRSLVRFCYRYLLTPTIIRNVTIVDHSHKTLVMKHELFRHLEIEIFVPGRQLRRVAAFVQEILTAFDSRAAELPSETRDELQRIGMAQALENLCGTFTHHYPVTFRRVRPDDTLISMTAAADEAWYAISFISFVESRDRFLAMGAFLLKSMILLFGARPHWGKLCPLTEKEAAQLYPRLADFRAICQRVDPHGVFQNDFTRRVLGFNDSEPRSARTVRLPRASSRVLQASDVA
jgi:FAD/FMN-containing dehydrogenase